jgi:hypothetical protein
MLDTVHVKKGIKYELVTDIEKYLEKGTRQFYTQRGVPYRRDCMARQEPARPRFRLLLPVTLN